jgi:cysteine synthase
MNRNIAQNITELLGNTPLVKLNKFGRRDVSKITTGDLNP